MRYRLRTLLILALGPLVLWFTGCGAPRRDVVVVVVPDDPVRTWIVRSLLAVIAGAFIFALARAFLRRSKAPPSNT